MRRTLIAEAERFPARPVGPPCKECWARLPSRWRSATTSTPRSSGTTRSPRGVMCRPARVTSRRTIDIARRPPAGAGLLAGQRDAQPLVGVDEVVVVVEARSIWTPSIRPVKWLVATV